MKFLSAYEALPARDSPTWLSFSNKFKYIFSLNKNSLICLDDFVLKSYLLSFPKTILSSEILLKDPSALRDTINGINPVKHSSYRSNRMRMRLINVLIISLWDLGAQHHAVVKRSDHRSRFSLIKHACVIDNISDGSLVIHTVPTICSLVQAPIPRSTASGI